MLHCTAKGRFSWLGLIYSGELFKSRDFWAGYKWGNQRDVFWLAWKEVTINVVNCLDGGHMARNCGQPLGAKSSSLQTAIRKMGTLVLRLQGNWFCQQLLSLEEVPKSQMGTTALAHTLISAQWDWSENLATPCLDCEIRSVFQAAKFVLICYTAIEVPTIPKQVCRW